MDDGGWLDHDGGGSEARVEVERDGAITALDGPQVV